MQKEGNASSLLASIKQRMRMRMGVDVGVNELQRAREDAEDKEKGTRVATYVDEVGEFLIDLSSPSTIHCHRTTASAAAAAEAPRHGRQPRSILRRTLGNTR